MLIEVCRLDQEAAIEEDEEGFDPNEEARDYEEVARNFPVFCVSSRAFQKLSGRLQKDALHINGFSNLEDTEIPQLQRYTEQLTLGTRVSGSRKFLNELGQLLNSMKHWATNEGYVAPSKEIQRINEEFLRTGLNCLLEVSTADDLQCPPLLSPFSSFPPSYSRFMLC